MRLRLGARQYPAERSGEPTSDHAPAVVQRPSHRHGATTGRGQRDLGGRRRWARTRPFPRTLRPPIRCRPASPIQSSFRAFSGGSSGGSPQPPAPNLPGRATSPSSKPPSSIRAFSSCVLSSQDGRMPRQGRQGAGDLPSLRHCGDAYWWVVVGEILRGAQRAAARSVVRRRNTRLCQAWCRTR
jgi:hypothetical protein